MIKQVWPLVAALCAGCAVQSPAVSVAKAFSVADFDARMAVSEPVVADGLEWIDGRTLPIEGRAFDDTDAYFHRLPSNVTTNVNDGVRWMKYHTTGMQFRFKTDSDRLVFKWMPVDRGSLAMDHMPATGVSGIDVYAYDAAARKWRYKHTGRIFSGEKGGTLDIAWTPGTPCLVNLPLYNGVSAFALGVKPGSKIKKLPPRANGIDKSVVFYGTSITHGGCASRPGLSWVNVLGRNLDVPIVNLGFSGSGFMELEMSEHLARIDASCYVLDCLWNMSDETEKGSEFRCVRRNYEPFIRNLRAKRPGVPIVMAEQCDVFCGPPNKKDVFVKALYDRLVAEGWEKLYYLPKTGMYSGDGEGTVDGCHPNDRGMETVARAFEKVVKTALEGTGK